MLHLFVRPAATVQAHRLETASLMLLVVISTILTGAFVCCMMFFTVLIRVSDKLRAVGASADRAAGVDSDRWFCGHGRVSQPL